MQKSMNIALIDPCQFTRQGLSQILSGSQEAGIRMNTFNFEDLNGLSDCQTLFDIIIYDPLHINGIVIDIDHDICRLKQLQPQSRIILFSTAAGFIRQPSVDGMFSKKIALADLSALWKMIVKKTAQREGYPGINWTAAHISTFSLSNSELSVLRGYYANLKTKQIAHYMGCDIKRVYYYKRTAFDKIQSMDSPFYNNARHFLR